MRLVSLRDQQFVERWRRRSAEAEAIVAALVKRMDSAEIVLVLRAIDVYVKSRQRVPRSWRRHVVSQRKVSGRAQFRAIGQRVMRGLVGFVDRFRK